jgi:Galactose oxidase, central domain
MGNFKGLHMGSQRTGTMSPIFNGISASFKGGFALLLFLLGIAGHGTIALAQVPDTFTATGDMTTARYGHTATLLPSGKVLIAGGRSSPLFPNDPSSSFSLVSAELYDPFTGTFTATGDMTTPRSGHTATLLPNGEVLIVGGLTCNSSDCLLASAELYDPSTGMFTATGSMTTVRGGYTATLLNNGKVLIAGGSNRKAFSLASAELYDPSTGTFTATGDMTMPRSGHTATLLPNGNVLITGTGAWSCCQVRGAELYDPDAGEFRGMGGTIPELFGRSRTTVTLTVLEDGKVLAMLGDAESPDPAGAAIYDPAAGAFTALADTTVWPNTATLLPDGTVLIAGPATVRYDPSTGNFVTTGNMVTPSYQQTATLLPNGTVLMSGGYFRGVLATAELYHPTVLVPAPVLFAWSNDDLGRGVILHASTHQRVSPESPAVAGEPLEIYGTGLIDGSVIPPQAAIGGFMAEVLFFGNVPGLPGVNQVNVRVPNDVAPGPAVSVRLNYLGRPSNEVTVGVR